MKNYVKIVREAVLYDKIGRLNRKIFRNKCDRKKLKNYNFSIISQNCIGSIIYHDLGLKFESPTINMLFKADDFVKFVSNIEKYIDKDIIFENAEQKQYPVGKLGDIVIEFVHYKTEEEVLEKWNDRKKRINWDNIFIIACDDNMSDNAVKQFEKIKYNNKVLFTNNLNHCINNSIYIKNLFDKADARLLNFCSITGKRYYQKVFDYIKWINNGRKLK